MAPHRALGQALHGQGLHPIPQQGHIQPTD
jgi:hypothetical protein